MSSDVLSSDLKLLWQFCASIGVVAMTYHVLRYCFRLQKWQKVKGTVLTVECELKSDNSFVYQLEVEYVVGGDKHWVTVDGGLTERRAGESVFLLCDVGGSWRCELVDMKNKIWVPLLISIGFIATVIGIGSQ
jgi:hypothetical protein